MSDIYIGPEILRDFHEGTKHEWLVTNGLGGYASSSLIGTNTRKYHGLLVVSLSPPVKRMVLLSSLLEEIEIDGKKYSLSSFRYGDSVSPRGHENLWGVTLEPFPEFLYMVDEVSIKKSICMAHGHNATVFSYEINNPSGKKIKFSAYPLVSFRDFHSLLREDYLDWGFEIRGQEQGVSIKPTYQSPPSMKMLSDRMTWKTSDLDEDRRWHRGLVCIRERERGYDSVEDLYSPGGFHISFQGDENFHMAAFGGTENQMESFEKIFDNSTSSCKAIFQNEKVRLEKLVSNTGYPDNNIPGLIKASDQFIVQRDSPKGHSIIAGYHWFSDWGRDTMISLPGLTLVTGRFDIAREILSTYAATIRKGIVPNKFSDYGQDPIYNSVDASMWFIWAAQKYLEYSRDRKFIDGVLKKPMLEIMDNFMNGTDYFIHMEDDGLIYAGSPDHQLTWMDAKHGDTVFTPRHGKAVEINSLWYNALEFLAGLKMKETKTYGKLARTVKISFNDKFWNKDTGCLFDVIGKNHKDTAIRPNQVFSISLPIPVLDEKRWSSVMDVVTRELLTPFGLRSLSPRDPMYRGRYQGGGFERDSAYHQGTVWGWLMGPYISAYVRSNGRDGPAKARARFILEPLIKAHMDAGCLGSISEIFDGDPPHTPRGTIAQAWSVAETLRCYVEDIINP